MAVPCFFISNTFSFDPTCLSGFFFFDVEYVLQRDAYHGSCIEEVRFGQKFKERWHSEENGVKDEALKFKIDTPRNKKRTCSFSASLYEVLTFELKSHIIIVSLWTFFTFSSDVR